MENGAAFYYMLRASGQGEVWRDLGEDDKFGQYGWRCSTSEDAYSNCTLTGNWCEERFDIRRLVQRRPLPSQFAHYFETAYSSSYNTERHHCISGLKREVHSFPGHQPELDPPHVKCIPNSIYREDFRDPQHHRSRTRATSAQQVQPGAVPSSHQEG
ncbi:cilia- and flagella-associated protein 68 [Paramormyrops kingsleyae]|uniref:Cilia and flagella associated protein 68 n=1 Tax=Paramormyrops kingsleyae TaxID=1676925 RepID=A0A3B3S9S9_9TELE|nr:UPF0686 protein C11orf1 homolog [Paramormyrops kingsleyae]